VCPGCSQNRDGRPAPSPVGATGRSHPGNAHISVVSSLTAGVFSYDAFVDFEQARSITSRPVIPPFYARDTRFRESEINLTP
jgi:hypothetical protein